MSFLNGLTKPYPEPKLPKTDKNIIKGDDDTLPEPSLSRKQKRDNEKFKKEMKDNTKY